MSTFTANTKNGLLDVGDGHNIYWEDWGNPLATPILHLHGGPGGKFDESHKALYDPDVHRVIFHDQRGCGRSLPFAETRSNTTQHLISDIEKLRQHLGIERMHLTGGSWGSGLSLFYALAHPERVLSLMLWSIFLGRQFEIDFLNEGYPRHTYPEAWERFVSMVPSHRRATGSDAMEYYHEMLQSADPAVAQRYADEWTLWEVAVASGGYDKSTLEALIVGDPQNIAIAKLEIHFFRNHCFVAENYILGNIGTIQHILCSIIHGRFDLCTPPSSAHDLHKAYGAKANLQWVNCGHMRTEPAMRAALQETARRQLL